MELMVCKDYQGLSESTANLVTGLVQDKPDALICIAAGHTPSLTCQLIASMAKEKNIDFSRVRFAGLDEWVGVSPQNSGSCRYFLQTYLFDHLNFTPSHIRTFDAFARDPVKECREMDSFIERSGGLDLIVVGLGMNGHIGFNEPGASFAGYSQLIELDDITRSVGKKYFAGEITLSSGLTLGLQYLKEAKKAVLIANGTGKAPIVKKALQEPVTEQVSASIFQTLQQGLVILDREAASLLDQ